jgi:DNA-binding MarR family transcriptional regulator
MFLVNGLEVDGEPGLVQLLDLAQREVIRSFADGPVQGIALRDGTQLRGGQYRVLSMVPRRDGRRLSDLASVAGMTKQAMGQFVNDLAAQGYVEIINDPSDGRAKLVKLTGRGREAADQAREILARVERLWIEKVGVRDIATLKRLLARLAAIE